jgi:hypothetical protein
VVRGLVALAGWETEGEESLLKTVSEARGLVFAGLWDFFVSANVADANMSATLLGCTPER